MCSEDVMRANFTNLLGFALMVVLLPWRIAMGDPDASFSIRSTAFSQNGSIPSKYTCEGEDVSPPLTWSNLPNGTQSLALIVEDPDVPDPKAPTRTWVHWVLYDLPPQATGLAEGVVVKSLPPGTRQGLSDWKRTGYGGPCPPIGRHRYIHTLYAIDTVLPDLEEPTKTQLVEQLQGHILGTAELIGTYERKH